MKRVGLLLAAGAVILGSAASAWAQAAAPPAFTVTFNGQARVVGGASDNTIDFVDTRADGKGGSAFKDSFHDFSNRFRLWTNVTSGDQHAGAVWALEVGDIIWGTGGGTSNNDGGGGNRVPQGLSSSSATARTGNGAGGAFGADGVNVETKHAYLWFDIPELPNARLTMGIQNVQFLTQPTEFVSEDAEAIKFDWKMDPIALQLWFARIGDAGGPGAPNNNAQDNDIYTARVWFKPIPDWTFSAEGMVWNQQCFSRQIATTTTPTTVASATPGVPVVSGVPTVSTARTGPCLKSDFGDTFFAGGTFSGKIAGIGLDGGVLYGQRELPGALGAA
ncbi:MAG: hypothetical protein DMD79_07900 [Candidatus Rokuibacteriota bacterium]|nr:MAG: hypothetical protein DMD79_07900 [Candidatus Rokubacteria bacterium]